MKSVLLVGAAVLSGGGTAAAQTFLLNPGNIEFRVVADNLVVTEAPGDNLVNFALQTRFVRTNAPRVATFGGTHGRIVSTEFDMLGVLDRASVVDGTFGNADFGQATQRGMTRELRGLFGGGLPNDSDLNGGDPNVASFLNPANGDGEFRWQPWRTGFANLQAFDHVLDGPGRADTDGLFVSVGLIDDTNGVDGDDTGIEPTDGITTDEARWDTVFLFSYTVTTFGQRMISFDYQTLGSVANPGANEDTVIYWRNLDEFFAMSNPARGLFRDDLSDNVQVVPTPGAVGLVTLGALVALRRRRG